MKDSQRPPVTPQPARTERVAVIVVHGVADRAPFDSVRQVASMLANVDDKTEPAYTPFTEHPIRVPVRRVPPAGSNKDTFFFASKTNGIPVDHRFTESQLRRFPELYDWVWHDALPVTDLKPDDIQDDRKPLPSELGVTTWVKAYRSGDYVGRWLWRPDTCGYQCNAPPRRSPWTAIDASLPGHSHDKKRTRREICVGSGAHTHYWDGTAPEVALEMDLLIRTQVYVHG